MDGRTAVGVEVSGADIRGARSEGNAFAADAAVEGEAVDSSVGAAVATVVGTAVGVSRVVIGGIGVNETSGIARGAGVFDDCATAVGEALCSGAVDTVALGVNGAADDAGAADATGEGFAELGARSAVTSALRPSIAVGLADAAPICETGDGDARVCDGISVDTPTFGMT